MKRLTASPQDILTAGRWLRRGGIGIYPTDTAYGIGGRFRSQSVRVRISEFKKRDDQKFTLIASSLGQVEKFFKLSATAKKLARKHWPGPLSIVVSPRFAVRVPAAATARRLAHLAGQPLIATSVNLSGQPPAYTSSEVERVLKKSRRTPDFFLDVGQLRRQEVSTVVRVTGKKVEVIRPGAVKID